MPAAVGIHQEGASRIVAVLVGEDPVQHQNLLALRMGVFGKGTARGVADQTGHGPKLTALAIQRLAPDGATGARLPGHRVRVDHLAAGEIGIDVGQPSGRLGGCFREGDLGVNHGGSWRKGSWVADLLIRSLGMGSG
jgi:hypothetical protein